MECSTWLFGERVSNLFRSQDCSLFPANIINLAAFMTLGGIHFVIVLIPPWHDKVFLFLFFSIAKFTLACPKSDIFYQYKQINSKIKIKKPWWIWSGDFQLIIKRLLGNMSLLSRSFYAQCTHIHKYINILCKFINMPNNVQLMFISINQLWSEKALMCCASDLWHCLFQNINYLLS